MSIFNSIQEVFQYDFMLYALITLIFLSFSAGLLSPIVVGKNYSFMGASISHASILGLSLSFILFSGPSSSTIFFTTLFITLLLSLFLARSTLNQSIPPDSLIGIFFTASMASGLLVHSLSSNQSIDLLSYLFGNILLITQEDLMISGAIALILCIVIIKKFPTWILYCLNTDIAKSQGVNIKFYHYLFFLLLTACIISSLKMAGAILINSFLITPGLFSLLYARSFKESLICSTLYALSTAFLGFFVANYYNLPVGATIAVFQFALLLLFKLIQGRLKL